MKHWCEKNKVLILTLAYGTWTGLFYLGVDNFFSGEFHKISEFLLLPILRALWAPLSGQIRAVAINVLLLALLGVAIVDAFRRSKSLSIIAIAGTILLLRGGIYLNERFAAFAEYKSSNQCSDFTFPMKQYCLHVIQSEDMRKRDLNRCAKLYGEPRAECISAVAKYTNNIDLCEDEAVDINNERAFCIGQFGDEILGRKETCERMRGKDNKHEDSANQCYFWWAVEKEDPKICEMIPIGKSDRYNDWFGFCMTRIAGIKSDISYCARLKKMAPTSNEYWTCIKQFEENAP